jgi:hypothetical protein
LLFILIYEAYSKLITSDSVVIRMLSLQFLLFNEYFLVPQKFILK